MAYNNYRNYLNSHSSPLLRQISLLPASDNATPVPIIDSPMESQSSPAPMDTSTDGFFATPMDFDLDLCQKTIGQQSSEEWWKARTGRITASNFGRVMSARTPDTLRRLSEEIKAPYSKQSYTPPACKLGLMEEPNAKAAYIKYQGEVNNVIVSIRDVGLCVPNWCSKIGATPDGIVNTSQCIFPHVLEIKCIQDCAPLPRSIVQVAKDRGSQFYCTVDAQDQLHLKRNHKYYYQVLGEMVATGLLCADFVIYHPRTGEIKVLKITYDQEDWNRMKEKLLSFTHTYLDN